MKFLSLCSGIEAASVAFGPLGWKAVAFAEIEPFPSAVLAHHYPDTPNLGDMTKFADWPEEVFIEADAIVGGPPCQAFSVAGLRKGLDDERGDLTLTYFHLINHADEVRAKHGRPPVIALYENVPGLLSDKTGAFGSLLAGLAGEDEAIALPKWPRAGVVDGGRRRVAWATLDAQFFGLAQRRRRVFVLAVPGEFVERLGDRAHPAEILSVGKSLRRDTPSRSSTRKGIAPGAEAGAGSGGYVPDATGALTARARNGNQSNDDVDGHKVITLAHGQGGAEIGFDRGPTLTCNHEAPIVAMEDPVPPLMARSGRGGAQTLSPGHQTDGHMVAVTHLLRGEGFDASKDGTVRGTPLVPVTAFANVGHFGSLQQVDVSDPLRAKGGDTGNGGESLVAQPVPMVNMQGSKGNAVAQEDGPSFTLQAMHGHDVHAIAVPVGVTLHGTDGTQSVASMTEASSSLRARIPSGVENSTTTAVLHPVGIFQDSEFGVQQYDSAGTLRAGRIPEHQMVMQPIAGSHWDAPENPHPTLNQSVKGSRVIAPTLTSNYGKQPDSSDTSSGPMLIPVVFHPTQDPISSTDGSTHALGCGGGSGQASVAVALTTEQTPKFSEECALTLTKQSPTGGGQPQAVLAPILTASNDPSRSPQGSEITAQVAAIIMSTMQVRRLTPVECERLQGFPDGYTAIPWRGKPADQCPDGPRYKALGNSWAVPCVQWIGARITDALSDIYRPKE